jgi:hypothetical protein
MHLLSMQTQNGQLAKEKKIIDTSFSSLARAVLQAVVKVKSREPKKISQKSKPFPDNHPKCA